MRLAKNLLRWVLMAALIYGIYTETGICTAIGFTLIAVYSELTYGAISYLVGAMDNTQEVLRVVIQAIVNALNRSQRMRAEEVSDDTPFKAFTA